MIDTYLIHARSHLRIALLAALGIVLATPAVGQQSVPTEPDTAATQPEAPPPLSVADITTRADQAAAKLRDIQKTLETEPPQLTEIAEKTRTTQAELDELLGPLEPGDLEDIDQSDVETLVQTLRRMNRQLASSHDTLDKYADDFDKRGRGLKVEQDYFQSVLDDERADDLPEALVDRITKSIRDLEAARERIRRRLDGVLADLAAISSLELRIGETEQAILAAAQRRERDILTFDRAPVWDMQLEDDPLPPLALSDIRARLNSVTEFVKANEARVAMTGLLLLVILGLTLYARPAISRLSEERDIALARRPFIERPVSLALLLWGVVVPEILLPVLPLGLVVLRLLIIVIALWRMLPVIAPSLEQGSLRGLLGLTILSGLLVSMRQSDFSDRLVLLLVSIAAIVFFRGFARALRQSGTADRNLWWRLGLIVSAVAPAVLAVSVAAMLIGAVAFAKQTTDGLLFLFTSILAIVTVEGALNTTAHFFISGSGHDLIRSFRRYPDLARRRFAALIRIGMLAIFLTVLPRIFPPVSLVYDGLIGMLTADITVGTVDMSAADVLALLAGIVIAVYVARFIRFTLDEDVFPRLPIATGAAAAASRLIYYALVAGGILFALAAGGVQLTKLTLIISALGVGIGFGLQGIVNNFVSGLVLAFERPFQVGDIIAVGTLTGRVREIGLRASRVRTFDGAEVIVPNADLIAGNVINWTLSDRMRRLDINVGVAYGTDPRRVREILLKVAADSEMVSKDPEPAALFTGFGDSSLNFTLRAWIPEAGDWPQISSDLYEKLEAAISAAGITIPFPQRTLHIESDARTPPRDE